MLVLLVAWAILRVVGGVCTSGADAIAWVADSGFTPEDDE